MLRAAPISSFLTWKNECVIQYDLLCYLILYSFLLISPFRFKFSLLLSSHPLSVNVFSSPLHPLASESSYLCCLRDSFRLYQKCRSERKTPIQGRTIMAIIGGHLCCIIRELNSAPYDTAYVSFGARGLIWETLITVFDLTWTLVNENSLINLV